jgi:uncharacterized protein YwqG
MRDIEALTAPLAAPAVHLTPAEGPSLSWLGGSPELPAGVPWPERNGGKLGFLARISLADLHRALPVTWLPRSGALLFFYDIGEQPWGFDPADRGGCAVLHVPDLDSPVTPRDEGEIPPKPIEFRRIDTVPSFEREAIENLDLSDEESDALDELSAERFDGMPKHQIAGFPFPLQGDQMELECQLVTNGLNCGDPSGYADPRAKTLEPGAKDWRLLLQFDSDEDLELMWGDCGTLYFWVQESAAAAGKFGNTWLVLQCS